MDDTISEVKKKRPGRVIRVSRDIELFVNKRRRTKESFDSCLRRLLGLPLRGTKDKPAKRQEVWVLKQPTLAVFENEADARGSAVITAVRSKRKKPEAPKKFVEML